MTATPEKIRQQLADLRQEYLRSLPDKVGEIESGWDRLTRDHWDDDRLRALHRYAHSLVGSGATFGHPDLSQAARRLEQAFKELRERKQPAGPQDRRRFEKLIMGLRQSVIHASRDISFDDVDDLVDDEPPRHRDSAIRRIFLVEDDELLARDMSMQLRHFGYGVNSFHTLAELREALGEGEPDAIVVDIVMPDGDSTVALGEFASESLQGIPILFITSYPDFESRLRAVRVGARAYLVKPVDIGELVDRLDSLTGVEPPSPYRVLIVDDSSVLAEYYALILGQAGMLVRTADDAARAMPVLEEFMPDLVLMDAYMPGCDGYEFAMVLRQQDEYMGIPIVFLSSETDPDRQLQALGIGADDFLTKPITPHHLVSAVAARAHRARLLQQAMVRDSLTGLLNHTTVKERVGYELMQAQRHGTPVTLAMVDIDHFKTINDRHGHLVGDRVIKSLSRLLQQRLRKSDLIGRYGGEEFLIVLNDMNGKTAQALFEDLRLDFAELRYQAGAETFSATFSAGIAVAGSGADPSALIDQADRAMYQAKQDGRNRVELVEG